MTVTTAELATELRKIVANATTGKNPLSPAEMNTLLFTARSSFTEPGIDLAAVIQHFAIDIIVAKAAKIGMEINPENFANEQGIINPQDPFIKQTAGGLYEKVTKHLAQVGAEGSFTHKGTIQKLTTAFSDVLRERGATVSEIGR